MTSIFSRIVAGEIPCHKVWEDERHLAFLDINPWTVGHTLVIPKEEVADLFEMDEEAYVALQLAARRVARILQRKLACARVCSMVVGWEVPHVHIHLIPTNSMEDLGGLVPYRLEPAPDLAALAARLRS